MSAEPKRKHDILHEILGGRMVGGTLSQLANYSDLFARMSEAVFLVDRNSLRVLECNPAACGLFELKEESILGVELSSLLGKNTDAEKMLAQTLHKFVKKSDLHVSAEIEYHNGSNEQRFFEISATTLKILDYIEVIQFIAKDVTEVRRAREELKEMNEALQNLSTTDEMTGLRNYRYLKEVIASIHHQSQNFKDQYGVVFIDVDHFKKFNDRNGHPAGDQVLKKVAEILKSTCRAQDLPCRYGGEEFVVLCRHSGGNDAMALAERIRIAIESETFPFGEFQPLGKVTASLGVSVFPFDGNSCEDILKHADEALYESKQQGRNRVTAYVSLQKKTA